MATFAVTYTYSADKAAIDEIRPTHRAWLAELLQSGTLLASGPHIGRPTALLLFKSESLEDLAALLDHDPFDIAGLIAERDIVEWNPVFGPFNG